MFVVPHRLLLTLCVQGMPLSFDTSHNKKVEGNYTGLVKRDTKRSARQYMNRIGHAPLFIATFPSLINLIAITPSHQLSSFSSANEPLASGGFNRPLPEEKTHR
jgi:hypothetical protein